MVLGIFQHVDALCHPDAIICSQAGALSRKIFVITYKLDGILLGVKAVAFFCYADHIHVPLQDGERGFFKTRRCRGVNNDIVHLILMNGKACLREVFFQEVAYCLLVARLAGNSSQLLELIKHTFKDFIFLSHFETSKKQHKNRQPA